MDQVTFSFSEEMRRDKNFHIFAYGGGVRNEKIRKIGCDFEAKKTLSLSEARVLFIECCEKYLNEINRHEKIVPFLIKHPLTEEEIDFGFLLCDAKGEVVSDDIHIASISTKEGMIWYDKYNSVTQRYSTLHKEPYQDALRIVKEQGYGHLLQSYRGSISDRELSSKNVSIDNDQKPIPYLNAGK